MNNLIVKLKESWNKLNEIVKTVLIVGILAAILLVGFYALKPSEYSQLFTGLNENDSIEIQKILSDRQIEFKTEEAGSTILVKGNASLIRGQVTKLGYPKNPEVTGLNKFDEMSIGSTEFDKSVQYQSRLQEDLERSIVDAFDLIERAKVKLPKQEKESFYKNEEKETKISVAIQTKFGEELSQENVRAIQLFVASSIQGLEAGDVEVMDSNMNVLSVASSDSSNHNAATNQFKIENGIKERIENDLKEALSKVYGNVQIIARVEVNFDEIVQNIEKYDPEGTLISNEQIEERERKVEGEVEGVVGAEENAEIPGYEVENLDEDSITYLRDKEHLIENLVVNKTLEKVIRSPELRNVSLTVIVDDESLSEEEVADLEETVAVAAGLTGVPERGNAEKLIYQNGEVKVTLKEFLEQNNGIFDEEEETEKNIPVLWFIIGGAIIAILLIVILFLIFARKKKNKNEIVEQTEPLENKQVTMVGMQEAKEHMKTNIVSTDRTDEEDKRYQFEWTEQQKDLRGLTNEISAKYPKETADVIRRMLKK